MFTLNPAHCGHRTTFASKNFNLLPRTILYLHLYVYRADGKMGTNDGKKGKEIVSHGMN